MGGGGGLHRHAHLRLGPGCLVLEGVGQVHPCSSARLTLAGTLRGKRWRRQEVRAFGGRKRTSAANGGSWGLGPLSSFSPHRLCATPVSSGPLLRVSSVSLMPHPGLLDIHAVQPAPFPGLRLLCAPTIPSLPCLPVSLFSAAQLPLITPPLPAAPPKHKPSALTRTRSSNFLGFVSSFTRCCWSTAPWLRHLLMLSVGGWGACSELPLPWPPPPPQGSRVWGQMRGEINRERERAFLLGWLSSSH